MSKENKEPVMRRVLEKFFQSILRPKGLPLHNGNIPQWVLDIRPNYMRISTLYLEVCFAVTIIMLLFQVALFLSFKFNVLPMEFGELNFSLLFKYFILPSSLNFGIMLFAWILLRHFSKSEPPMLNLLPIVVSVLICTISASTHPMYSITLMLFCVPVLMTAIYGVTGMTYFTAFLCSLGLCIAGVCRASSPYWHNSQDSKFFPEILGAFAFLFVATALARIMILLLDTQKRRLILATAEASQASQAKSEFLANMSHEIRTPLNTIIGLTEMVLRKASEPEIQEYASDIQQAGNGLLALINDVLDISKIESGKVEIVESDYELGSLINDSYNMVAVQWHKKGLSANVICDPNLPRMLCGDEYHLRQIIVNLLSNAVKYTKDGGIVMRVAGEGDNSDILCMSVSVRDSGIGIKEVDIPKLFGKFDRLEDAKKNKIEGTGLGLSIVKQLLNLMNGTIEVESLYGVGSTFTVRIPQKIKDKTPIGDIHSTYLDMHGEVEKYHRSFEAPDAHILVVDDIPINLRVVLKLLEDTKIQVDTAGSGEECLKKVCKTRYDLILMDHMMPGMDGIDTLKAMHKLPDSMNEGVPVIMLTANAMIGAREGYIEAGFTNYLAKPVRGARLESMILRYLSPEKVVRFDEGHEDHDSSDTGVKPAINRAKKIEVKEVKQEAKVEVKEEPVTFSFDRLREALPELDIETGLSYCANDKDFYQSMLKEFAESCRDAVMETHFSAKDWDNYRIAVHSLKSTAKMMGFATLSDESLQLEKAAKESNSGYIMGNHAGVVAHYRRIIAALTKSGI